MDIHRCRFIPYPPSAINALAFSHPSAPSTKSKTPTTLRLAIGRANGDIEIWNPLKGAWFQESILQGGRDRTVEGLVWTHDPEEVDQNGVKSAGTLRLFSIGYSTAVTEWDLATGRPLRHSTGNYGDIWCMAAQPRAVDNVPDEKGKLQSSTATSNSPYQDLAVGCADGSIVLLSTADGDLQFKRILARPSKKKARVLSLTFQDKNTVVAGHADSTIRIYNTCSNQLLRSMSLGAGPVGGPKEILVWTVKCTNDGTIVSGDSTGTVQFWDGKQYTLIQRITGHVADVLDLAIGAGGHSVFSAGMDRRTTVYRRREQNVKGDSLRWKQIAHQRIHKHDVKAMASYEDKNLSVIASGGLDTTPIITPCQEFGREHHRSLSHLPQQPCICSSPQRRLLMTWWSREICVWKFSRVKSRHGTIESLEGSPEPLDRRLISKIELQGENSLTCANLSTDGSLLAAATMFSVRIFRLKFKIGDIPKVQRVEVPLDLANKGARLVHFSPDRRWLLVVRPDSLVQLYRITGDGKRTASLLLGTSVSLSRLRRPIAKSDFRHGSLGRYDRTICRASFSTDSRILAVGDLSGYIDTWVLEGLEDLNQTAGETANGSIKSKSSDDEDSDTEQEHHPTIVLGQHWIKNPAAELIPRLRAAVLVLAFRPSHTLTQALTNGNIALHPTRHNPHPHSHELPKGEDRLLAVTSGHQICEFEVLRGRLSDWSRRNPTASFPPDFRDMRERTMGTVWDISRTRQRVWLYGSTWLWMFDLSKDVPPVSGQNPGTDEPGLNDDARAKKRKRNEKSDTANSLDQEGMTRDTGAGSRICGSEVHSGVSRKMRKTRGAEPDESELIDLIPARHTSPEDDDDDAADQETLLEFRRSNGEKPQSNTANAITESDSHISGATDLARAEKQQNPPYWCTYMYRPILGIVPLSGAALDARGAADGINEDNAGEDEDPPEVALVERPLEEVELPPRFYGDQEWDEKT